MSHHLPQNALALTEEDIIALGPIHLVVGGPPCQDLSKARLLPTRSGRRGKAGPGFKGARGALFLHFTTIIAWVRKHNPDCKFLVENVVFDHLPHDFAKAADLLGQPTIIDSHTVSYTRRKRAYWHNIDLHPGWDAPILEDWHANQMLDPGRSAVDDNRTITASWSRDAVPRQLTHHPFLVRDRHGMTHHLRPHEAERLMGLPAGYTDVCNGEQLPAHVRLHHIGNGMDVITLQHILRNFLPGLWFLLE